MPFDKSKIKIVDEDGYSLGYKCEFCGAEVRVIHGRQMETASSAMTNHIKSKHPKEYEEYIGHPPIWRYRDWKNVYVNGKWKWKKKEDKGI